MQTTPDETYSFGEFTLNLTHECLYRDRQVLHLEPKALGVLTYLVKNRYRPIKKDKLLDAVWGEKHAGAEGSLVHCITAIRKALGDEVQKKIIETKHGIGYRFNPDAANVSLADEKVIKDPREDLIEEGQVAVSDGPIASSLLETDETDGLPTPAEDLSAETDTDAGDVHPLGVSAEESTPEIPESEVLNEQAQLGTDDVTATPLLGPEPTKQSTTSEDVNTQTQTGPRAISDSSVPIQEPDLEPTTLPTTQNKVQATNGDSGQTTSEQIEWASSLPPDALLENTQTAAGSDDELLGVHTKKTDYEDLSRTIENEFSFIAGIACLVAALVFVCILFGKNWSAESQTAFIQASLILGGVAYNLPQLIRFKKSDLAKDHAQIAVGQFQTFWTLLLVSWVCLYFVWTLGTESSQLRLLTTLLNNSNSLMLFLCYLVLNEPTLSTVGEHNVGKVPLKFGLNAIIVCGAITVAVFGVFQEILISVFKDSPTQLTYTSFAFDSLSGMVGGITMALCISRLHSRLMGKSTWLPIVAITLYLYVVIQPFFVLVNQTLPNLPSGQNLVVLKPWIMWLAFMLKILMFIYVTGLIGSDRLLFYMIHARRIYNDVEREWEAFKSQRRP